MTKKPENGNEPTDMLNISKQTRPTRELLLDGEELGDRRGAKKLVALTRCSVVLSNADSLDKCVATLRESDAALRRRPEELKLWDWQMVVRDGMTIHFGVAWYDMDFFNKRKEAFKDPTHLAEYGKFGAKVEDFHIQHFVAYEG